MRYAFVEEHRGIYPIAVLCRVLQVSRSGFYAWQGREPSARALENAQLVGHLERVHAQSRETYGVLKAYKALQHQGITCGRNRVARLRAVQGIYARGRKRFVVTTRSRRAPGIAPNRLNRQFQVAEPNQVWVTDVTFIATRQGWLFSVLL